MWIKADGQLSESTYLLTTPVSSHLLCFGEVAAVVDAGIAAYANQLSDSLSTVLNEDLPLKYILLTHAHFDHIGGVPALRRRFPGIEVVGSPLSVEVLREPGRLEEIFEKNQRYALSLGVPWEEDLESFKAGLWVDKILSEGDSIPLGADVDVKVVNCPGHTVDTTGYLVRPDAALAAAEAVGGYNGREKLAPCFLQDLEVYVSTLDKLLTLDLKVLLLPHAGALSGDLAKRFLMGGRDQARAFRDGVLERLNSGAIREELYFDLLNEWAVDGLSPEGPFTEEQNSNLRRMIDLVLGDADK